MKTDWAPFRKNTIRNSALVGTLLLVLAFSSLALLSASATTVFVSLSLNPAVNTAHRGTSVGETLFVDNHLTSTFTAKNCKVTIFPPTGGSTTITCPTAFPSFTVPAGSTVGHFYRSFVSFGTKAPLGRWDFFVVIGGTVNGKSVSSRTGSFAVVVS